MGHITESITKLNGGMRETRKDSSMNTETAGLRR